MSRGEYTDVTIKSKGGATEPAEGSLEEREMYIMQAENQPPRLFVGTSGGGVNEITTIFKLNKEQYGDTIPNVGVEGQVFFKIDTPENIIEPEMSE